MQIHFGILGRKHPVAKDARKNCGAVQRSENALWHMRMRPRTPEALPVPALMPAHMAYRTPARLVAHG